MKLKFLHTKFINSKFKVYFFGIHIFSYKPRVLSLRKYVKWLREYKTDRSKFMPFAKSSFVRQKGDPKVFAFYLPQFYPIPENNNVHGKGFTEWTNVASCMPQFIGHEQPKVPYDVGFYNLLLPGIMERQVEIAKTYGVYGFCFYWYWFSGKKLLEKPLEYFLHSSIDFKFHFCWANENWSHLWDGGNKEIILKQELHENDADKFFSDILPYIKDPRYEKIGNKPLLIIYRPKLFNKTVFSHFIHSLQSLSRQAGFDGLFIRTTHAFGGCIPAEYYCDGLVEFPPHGLPYIDKPKNFINPEVPVHVSSLSDFISNKEYIYKTDFPVFKTCFPSWDNTPRKLYSDARVWQLTSEEYQSWLSGILQWTKNTYPTDLRYAYINAWNEWAEGAILEPTVYHGYQNLSILKRCLEQLRSSQSLSKE